MDFLARAGTTLERAHRLAGVLMGIIIILLVVLYNLMQTNAEIKAEYKTLQAEMSVYVVPGSISGIYQPTQPEMLLKEFSTFVVQSLSTYTFANLDAQYGEVKNYFLKSLARDTDKSFAGKLLQVRNDEQSAIFIEDRDSFKVEIIGDSKNLDDVIYQVTLRGLQQYIIGGNVVEAVPVKVTLKCLPAFITKTNPFGFVLSEYKAEEYKPTAKRP